MSSGSVQQHWDVDPAVLLGKAPAVSMFPSPLFFHGGPEFLKSTPLNSLTGIYLATSILGVGLGKGLGVWPCPPFFKVDLYIYVFTCLKGRDTTPHL